MLRLFKGAFNYDTNFNNNFNYNIMYKYANCCVFNTYDSTKRKTNKDIRQYIRLYC